MTGLRRGWLRSLARLHLRRVGCVAGFGGRATELVVATSDTAHRIAGMYVPTATTDPTATLRDFTVEHVRVLVAPDRAHTTALALMSGMLPPFPVSETEPDPLGDALTWFGTYLFPAPAPTTDLASSRMIRMRSAHRCVTRLAGNNTACVLDLVVVRHTTAITRRKGRRDTALCGFATLSVADDVAPYVSMRDMRYGDGQLRIPFAATNSTTPRDTLDELRRAVELTGTATPDNTVPLVSLAAGRTGGHSDPDNSTCTRFAHFSPPGHDVWRVRPATVGADIAYDAHIAQLSGRAHYRVFDAALPGDDIYERV